MQQKTRIASHRGGAQVWPENSREAFRNSMALSVDLVEFDLHLSSDGVVVVHHDPLLGRTSDGDGPIEARSWAELQQVTLKRTQGETIPSFEEVLDILTARPMGLRIEIKVRHDGSRHQGIEGKALTILRRRDVMERVCFTSFDLATLAELRRLDAAVPLIYLVKAQTAEAPVDVLRQICRDALVAGAEEIALRVNQLRDGDKAVCDAAGVRLGVFAAHDAATIARAYALGLSAFTTDRPDIAIAVRDRLASQRPEL